MTKCNLGTLRGLRLASALLAGSLATLGGCGGGGADPLGNPPQVVNSGGATGQSLSFAYFQRCVNPILQAAHTIDLNGVVTSNTCSSAGCHAAATGRGGALRLISTATTVDLTDPANTSAVIQTTDMYKNFYSAQAEVIINNPGQSLLINKPLLRNVLHGGGLIFSSAQDPNILIMEYWISNPMPAGQDEFSLAAANLFTPSVSPAGQPAAWPMMYGTCNTN
jgi:hypothetical protein